MMSIRAIILALVLVLSPGLAFAQGGYNPSSGSASGVASFNLRTGAVVPALNDYSFSLLSGQSSLAQLPSLGAYLAYCNATAGTATPTACHTAQHSLDWGALGNGSTDDTTALQNWANACQANTLYLCVLDQPSVCYKTSAAITITASIAIDGINPVNVTGIRNNGGTICASNATQDVFDITTSVDYTSVTINNISITSSTTPTSGNFIKLTSATNYGVATKFDNVTMTNCWTCINVINAGGFHFDHVYLFKPQHDCMEIAGWGDSWISNSECVLLQTSVNNNGILLTTSSVLSGGLYLNSDKFNGAGGAGGTGCAIDLNSGSTSPASDLNVVGGSIEGYSNGICLNKGSVSTQIGNVNIVGVEFGVLADSCITTDNNTGWLTNLNILGGSCNYSAAAGMAIGGAPSGFSIQNVVFNGTGTSTQASITVASGAANGYVCNNKIYNSTTAAYITNASTTTVLCDANGMARASIPTTLQNGSSLYDTTTLTWDDAWANSLLARGGTLYSATANAVTSGTGASTLISATGVGTLTIPAGGLKPGKTIRISLAGTVTTQASPGTVTITVALGGTTVAVSSAASTVTASTTNGAFGLNMLITCQATGTTATVIANSVSGIDGTTGVAALSTLFPTSTAAANVNTANAQALTITSTNSVSGGTVFTVTSAIVEVLS